VGVEISSAGGSVLCIRVGPFVDGGAQRLIDGLEVPGMGVSLAKLANRVDVVRDDERGEFVELELSSTAAG
jgi:hypothetical protein